MIFVMYKLVKTVNSLQNDVFKLLVFLTKPEDILLTLEKLKPDYF